MDLASASQLRPENRNSHVLRPRGLANLSFLLQKYRGHYAFPSKLRLDFHIKIVINHKEYKGHGFPRTWVRLIKPVTNKMPGSRTAGSPCEDLSAKVSSLNQTQNNQPCLRGSHGIFPGTPKGRDMVCFVRMTGPGHLSRMTHTHLPSFHSLFSPFPFLPLPHLRQQVRAKAKGQGQGLSIA